MKWVTRQNVTVDGVACPWLVVRFIDDEAEFGFVPAEQVLAVAEREQAISFAAPGARYAPANGKCTFEILIEEYNLVAPGLDRLARIVHAAELATELTDDAGGIPEGAGLRAIAAGFALDVESDVERQHLQWPLYDALLAWCVELEAGEGDVE